MNHKFILALLLFVSLNVYSKEKLKVSAICIAPTLNMKAERAIYGVYAIRTCAAYDEYVMYINKPGRSRKIPADKLKKIRKLIEESDVIDIFVMGHTNSISGDFQFHFGDKLKGKLRLVYNTGCENGEPWYVRGWMKMAKTYVAHEGNNYGAYYMPRLIRRWMKGKPIGLIVKEINEDIIENHQGFFEGSNNPLGQVHGDPDIFK